MEAQSKEVKMRCGRMICLVDGIPERCCHSALKVKNSSKINFLLNKGTFAPDDELIDWASCFIKHLIP